MDRGGGAKTNAEKEGRTRKKKKIFLQTRGGLADLSKAKSLWGSLEKVKQRKEANLTL